MCNLTVMEKGEYEDSMASVTDYQSRLIAEYGKVIEYEVHRLE